MNKEIKIAEIMTRDPITLNPCDTMDKVQEIFASHLIHHIPVVENGKVCGIISQTDYLKLQHGFTLFRNNQADAYNDAIMRSLLVKEVMVVQVATLYADDTVNTAFGFFRENLFHALPILDRESRKLVGIVTTFDLLNYAYKEPAYLQS